MYTHTCKNCGKPFEAPQKKRSYCGRDCYKPAGKNPIFSNKQQSEIVNLYTKPDENGHYIGATTIARDFGVTTHTIINILDKHGIEKRSKTFYVKNQPHHNLKRVPPKEEEPPLCKCGCEKRTYWIRKKDRWAKYCKGHYTQSQKQNPRWNGGQIDYICQECGKIFQGQANEQKKYCSNECAGVARRSPNYEGRERWIKWDTIRRKIRKRDNWTCRDCGFYGKGIKRAIHVHHIDENPMNNNPDNLVCLCAKCHLKRHGCDLPEDWEYDGIAF